MAKHEELYEYSKGIYEEEISRFSRVEDKASRFITVTTSLLAVYGLASRQLFGELIPVDNAQKEVLVFFGLIILIGLFVSWVFSFMALCMQGMSKPPLNEDMIEYWKTNKLKDVYASLSSAYSEALIHNREITDRKAVMIKRGYWSIIVTVSFFILFMIAYMIIKDNAPSASKNTGVIEEKVKKRGGEVSLNLTNLPVLERGEAHG